MLLVAHRGFSGIEPENTMRAFRAAVKHNAIMIELDVHLCKSGEVVVIHDSTLKRTTNGSGRIAKKTWAELKQLDAGKGERIPLLRDVLKNLKGKIKLNIELKGKGTALPVLKCIKAAQWKQKDLILSSFKLSELQKVKKHAPNMPLAFLVERKWGALRACKKNKFGGVHIAKRFATKKFVDQAHKEGLWVHAWSINTKKEAKKLAAHGVDAVTSNYPIQL